MTLANVAFFTDLGRSPELTDADLAAIRRPVLLVNSNRDPLVAWEETVQVGTRVPGARLVMFHGIAHPFRNVPANPVGRVIGAWVEEVCRGLKLGASRPALVHPTLWAVGAVPLRRRNPVPPRR